MGPAVKACNIRRLSGEVIRLARVSSPALPELGGKVPRRKDKVEKQRKAKRSLRRKEAVGARVRRPGRISIIRKRAPESLISWDRMGSMPVRQRRWMRV